MNQIKNVLWLHRVDEKMVLQQYGPKGWKI